MYNQYIILADAKPGREQEFDDWYHWVHIREVMEPRIAAIAAQCFRRVAELPPEGRGYRQRFLCLYENSDPEAMTGPRDASRDPMRMSSAIDTGTKMGGGYYDTIVQCLQCSDPDQTSLVVEWIEADAQAIGKYITARLPALIGKQNVLSAWLGKASEHQLYDAPRPAYVAMYRVKSVAHAALVWNEIATEIPLPASIDLTGSCFTPIFGRVTRMQMLAPDAAARENIARARAAVR